MRITLRLKLVLFSASAVVALMVILGLTYYASYQTDKAHQAQDIIYQQAQQLNQIVVLEQSYLLTPNKSIERQVSERLQALKNQLSERQQLLEFAGLSQTQLSQAHGYLSAYQQSFENLARQQAIIGFNPKDGAYGSLRSAVHQVESSLKLANDYRLMAGMLQLRRAEKDFMLRFDKKYLLKFSQLIDEFDQSLNATNSGVNKTAVRQKMADYKRRFEDLVAAEEVKGLVSNSGLRAELKRISDNAVKGFAQLSQLIQQKNQQTLSRLKQTTALIGLIVAGIILSLSLITVKSIASRVRKLQQQIAEIEDSKDLTRRISVKHGDEFAAIAEKVNSLVESLHSVLLRVTSSTSTLDHTTTVINDNATKANQGSKVQIEETSQIEAAINEMSKTIEHLSRTTDQTSNDALDTAHLAKKGIDQLSELAIDVHSLADMLNGAQGKVVSLQQKSEQVGSVLSVITTIAEQTNLLALNAAIEAARAGDHGRGFAVVADEVRQLAMKTQESTVNIRQIIDSLNVEIAQIVEQIEHSAENGEAVSASAADVNSALSQIVAKIDSVSEKNANIATAIEQQGYTARDIGKNINGISGIAKEAASRTKDNQSISKMLYQESIALSEMLSEFELGEVKFSGNVKQLSGTGFDSI